jgi:hypothetical protein
MSVHHYPSHHDPPTAALPDWLTTPFEISFVSAECSADLGIPMVISSVTALLVFGMGFMVALADMSPNPASRRWLAQSHSGVEVKAFLLKTAMVLCANMFVGNWELLSGSVLIFTGWLPYVYLRWVRM